MTINTNEPAVLFEDGNRESDPAVGTLPNEKPGTVGTGVVGMTDAERAGTAGATNPASPASVFGDHPDAEGNTSDEPSGDGPVSSTGGPLLSKT